MRALNESRRPVAGELNAARDDGDDHVTAAARDGRPLVLDHLAVADGKVARFGDLYRLVCL